MAGGRNSLDNLIRPHQHRRRDRQAERLRGLEIDNKITFRRLLDRQIGRFGALENPIDGVTQMRRGATTRLPVA